MLYGMASSLSPGARLRQALRFEWRAHRTLWAAGFLFWPIFGVFYGLLESTPLAGLLQGTAASLGLTGAVVFLFSFAFLRNLRREERLSALPSIVLFLSILWSAAVFLTLLSTSL